MTPWCWSAPWRSPSPTTASTPRPAPSPSASRTTASSSSSSSSIAADRGARSGGGGLLEAVQAVHGLEVLLDEALDDGAGLLDLVELAHDLAARVEQHRLRLVGGAGAPGHAVARDHVLQRHGEGVGGVGRLPGVSPLAAQHAAGLAGEAAAAHGVPRGGVEELLLLGGRQV